MAMTNSERQEKFRKQMYDAGFKNLQIWVPKKSESRSIKLERKVFAGKLEEITAGWPRVRLTRLFNDLIQVVKKHAKEDKRK